MAAKPVPVGMTGAAATFWVDVTKKYILRTDELRILEDVCNEISLIDLMRTALVGVPLTVEGSQGQQVPHPLLAEIRQHRAILRALISALKLPDEGGADSAGARSAAGRDLVNNRWKNPGTRGA